MHTQWCYLPNKQGKVVLTIEIKTMWWVILSNFIKKIMNNVPNYESNHNCVDSLVNSDSTTTTSIQTIKFYW